MTNSEQGIVPTATASPKTTADGQQISAPAIAPPRPQRRSRILPLITMLGLLFLSFLLGATLIYYQLPPWKQFDKACRGMEAWWEKIHTKPRVPGSVPEVVTDVDKPTKTFDGFTLYTTDHRSEAVLIDMRGKVVHHWEIPFSAIWPKPTHVKERKMSDDMIYFFGCHLFPDGRLLAVFQAEGDTPYGYGLAMIDKDSKLKWKYTANVHHDVTVDEHEHVFAMTQEIVHELPRELKFIPAPCMVDFLVELDPETGEELKKVPVLDAFQNSSYAMLLNSLEAPSKAVQRDPEIMAMYDSSIKKGDVLHTNSIQVLSSKLQPKFPMFKTGWVLISLRVLNCIAMVDMDSKKVMWAARGPWHGQHDAQFIDPGENEKNGRILLFDNFGSLKGSRVLEYDPQTQALPWSYSNENSPAFTTRERGMCQRLPNGNTLLVDSATGRILEVTRDKELVWRTRCGDAAEEIHIPCARRYGPKEVTFLGDKQPRP